MMQGYGNTGDSVYGHHLDFLNDRTQATIDSVSRYLMELGQDGESITKTDIEGLFYCAAFADSLEGRIPGKEAGYVTELRSMDEHPPGLGERLNFEIARGDISGALPHKAIEERKPTSQTAEALKEERKLKMESNREEWVKTNPELVKKMLGITGQEDISKKMDVIIQSIPGMVRKILEEELKKSQAVPSVAREPTKEKAETKQEPPYLPPLLLEYHVDSRYWKVDTSKKTKRPDIEQGLVYPDEAPAEVPLSISLSDRESKASVASVEYKTRILNLEAYERLYNRLKFLISEFLDADNEGNLVTDIEIREPSEGSLWTPITRNGGRPLRTASITEYNNLKEDAILEIKLGSSYLKTGVSFDDDEGIYHNENVTRFAEDLSRIIEMILRTSETTEQKKEKV